MLNVIKNNRDHIKLLVVCGIVRALIMGISNSMSFIKEITFQKEFTHVIDFTEKEIMRYLWEDVGKLALSLPVDEDLCEE